MTYIANFERPGQMWFLIHRDPERRERPKEISRHPSREAAMSAASDGGLLFLFKGQSARVLISGYWVVPEEVIDFYMERGNRA